MSDSEINQAIAEWMGWKGIIFRGTHEPKHLDYVGNHESCRPEGAIGNWQCQIPNFCGDLNAIHEAVYNHLPSDGSWTDFVTNLQTITNTPSLRRCDIMILVHATARQRAEALIRTLNLWRDQ